MSKAITVSIVAALAAGAISLESAAIGRAGPLVAPVAKCPTIILRQQKDPRIVLHQEKFGKTELVHIYLTLSNEAQAYIFSLGWFKPSEGPEGPICIDELGQQLPMPGEKPAKINKVALHEIKGFDLISAHKQKQALKEFEDAVHDPQGSPRLYSNLGACLALLGEYDKAQQQLDLALRMQADCIIARVNKAWLELARGKNEEALADARKALELDPEMRSARFAAVKAQLNLSQYDGALQLSEDTLKHWPSDPASIIMSGDVLAAGGDYKNARMRYQKALLLLPNEPQLMLKLAQSAQVQGDLDEALKRSRQVTISAPDLPEGHLALGRYLEMNREMRAAQIQFERALELDPPMSTKLAIYGPMLRVLIAQNKSDEADKLSRKWLSADDDNADCHFNRAWIASQLHGPEHDAEAIDEYRKAMALNKDLVQGHYNVALLLLKQGKNTEAARELKTFIQLAPTDPDIANAKKLLAQIGK